MRRLYTHTRINVVGAGSDWFDNCDKALIAQIEPNPANEKRNIIVEYWRTTADKDADIRETEGQAKAETPRWPELEAYLRSLAADANPAKAPEARSEASGEEQETAREPDANPPPEHTPVLVFVRGLQNFWGFVAKMEADGSYTTCTNPTMAWDFGTPDRAYAATEKMRAYETENHNWDRDYFVLAHERTLKAVRHMPEPEPGRVALMYKA